jgi:hypothetical protein
MAPEPTPEAWAQIRTAYEHTDRPIEDICIEHGTSSGTLRDRVRRWQWKRRRAPIPREGPPAAALVAPPPAPVAARDAETAPSPTLLLSGGGSSGAPPERPIPPAFADVQTVDFAAPAERGCARSAGHRGHHRAAGRRTPPSARDGTGRPRAFRADAHLARVERPVEPAHCARRRNRATDRHR